jgi:L-amino acid N-acyltransferase YncA
MTNRISAAVPSFGSKFSVRRASPEDAEGIATVLSHIASERVYSAIDQPWPSEQQRRYLESLSEREVFHIALDESGAVIGFQSLDLWSPPLRSMTHVGQLGTFLLAEWRRRGVGRALFQTTASFARRQIIASS